MRGRLTQLEAPGPRTLGLRCCRRPVVSLGTPCPECPPSTRSTTAEARCERAPRARPFLRRRSSRIVKGDG
jgi:hypothetical protein